MLLRNLRPKTIRASHEPSGNTHSPRQRVGFVLSYALPITGSVTSVADAKTAGLFVVTALAGIPPEGRYKLFSALTDTV